MKNILFRADSSSIIGTGHIMRDLVLASKYKESNIIFATQNLDGNIDYKIKESGYSLKRLNSNSLKELNILIKYYFIDMIVIDNYEIDAKFESRLKKNNPKLKILCLDDTYEKHNCDILINHNIGADKKKYKGLVPKNCKLKCGSKYTLIRDEFIKEKKRKIIFLAIGGADHSNINIKILKILSRFKHIKINLVTTTANKNLEKLKDFCDDKSWIKLHIDSSKIAKLMRKSDFAIVTPSVILNEVYFMKLPFIAIKTAKNQKDIYSYLKEKRFNVLEKLNSKKLVSKINLMLKTLG